MKLVKQNRYNKNGIVKVNCYHVNISKKLLERTDIKENDELLIYVKDNKIIIEKQK